MFAHMSRLWTRSSQWNSLKCTSSTDVPQMSTPWQTCHNVVDNVGCIQTLPSPIQQECGLIGPRKREWFSNETGWRLPISCLLSRQNKSNEALGTCKTWTLDMLSLQVQTPPCPLLSVPPAFTQRKPGLTQKANPLLSWWIVMTFEISKTCF